MYQARACCFEAEITAPKGEGLSVGADVFYGSNVDPVRLQNAHLAWMTLMNSCREMALEAVQRSEAPNDAWRNLQLHYRKLIILGGYFAIPRGSRKNDGTRGEPFQIYD